MKKLAFLMILIIFVFGLFGIYTVIAGTASSFSPIEYDRAALSYRSLDSIDFYTPRSYNQVCNKIRLPIIRKGEMQLQSSPLLYNPYLPPPSTPYP